MASASVRRRMRELSTSMFSDPTLPNIVLGGAIGAVITGTAILPWTIAYILAVGTFVFGREIERTIEEATDET